MSVLPGTAPSPSRRVLIPTVLPRSLPLGGGAPARAVWSFAGETMGTHWRAHIVSGATDTSASAEAAQTLLRTTFAQVVALMSPWAPSSDLARFAAAAPGEWITLAPETATVLARALEVAALTAGAYDPTLGAVSDLLGFGPSGPDCHHDPDTPTVAAARAAAGYQRLDFDPARRAVRQPGGLRLDLCSIAKGYAVDLASDRLHAAGWTSHFIEIGGEARGRGCKPDGQPWWCGLETPAGATPTVAALCELAVATSGNTLHFRDTASGRIGHILPRGRPTLADASTVTVLAPTCMVADAWATALHALGPGHGLTFAIDHDLAVSWLTAADAHHPTTEVRSPAFEALLS